jgi:hypothetical protein
MAPAGLARHGRSRRCDQPGERSHLRATVAAAERRLTAARHAAPPTAAACGTAAHSPARRAGSQEPAEAGKARRGTMPRPRVNTAPRRLGPAWSQPEVRPAGRAVAPPGDRGRRGAAAHRGEARGAAYGGCVPAFPFGEARGAACGGCVPALPFDYPPGGRDTDSRRRPAKRGEERCRGHACGRADLVEWESWGVGGGRSGLVAWPPGLLFPALG